MLFTRLLALLLVCALCGCRAKEKVDVSKPRWASVSRGRQYYVVAGGEVCGEVIEAVGWWAETREFGHVVEFIDERSAMNAVQEWCTLRSVDSVKITNSDSSPIIENNHGSITINGKALRK